MMVDRWRADTPAALAGRVHLNNAGASLMPKPVAAAVFDHLHLECSIGGYEAAEAAAHQIAAAYDDVAALIGTTERNVAVVENATVAFAQALSAFDFAPGDVIVTTRTDYVSNQLMYLSLERRRGVRVLRAEDAPEGGVDPESLRALLREHRPRLVGVTWIPTNTGLVQPMEAVAEVCAEAGVPLIVDACQAVGQLPIDLRTLRCDYLAATARKFLRGPRGIGFLYVSEEAIARGDAPLYVDLRGAEWQTSDGYELAAGARRFENWEFAYALMLGLGAAARYAREVGVEQACERSWALAAHARARLAELEHVRVLDRGARQSAIVAIEVSGYAGEQVVAELRELGINTSAILREFAVIDMDAKGAASGVRLSPHYFNTQREVDLAVEAIAALG